jgi:hypothetical protein
LEGLDAAYLFAPAANVSRRFLELEELGPQPWMPSETEALVLLRRPSTRANWCRDWEK